MILAFISGAVVGLIAGFSFANYIAEDYFVRDHRARDRFPTRNGEDVEL